MHQVMRKIIFNPLLCASLFTLFLFLHFLFLVKPIYDTGEDVYILYLLSGGFGNSPTELLHYNHGLHPYLGYLLKTLFVLNSNINWYSLALIISHYSACTIILYYLLKNKPNATTLFLYLLLFVVFECRFLITPNFSNTAIVLGSSGIFLLFTVPLNSSAKIKSITGAILILLVAAMFRIHVLIPLVVISLPFAVMSTPGKFVLVLPLIIGLIFLLNYSHQQYYESKITGWRHEENYRQKIYKLYNHKNLQQPVKGQKWYTEFNLINSGLAIDSAFLSSKKIEEMAFDLRKNYTAAKSADSRNWFWINNRIFFCIVVFILILACTQKKLMFTSLLSLMAIAGVCVLLVVLYSKLPEYILISTLFLWCLLALYYSKEPTNYNGKFSLTAAFCLTLWGCIQLYKINQNNIRGIEYFRSAFSEIAAQRQQLFLITGDAFPLQKYYIWNLPKDYMLFNFLGNDHFLNNIYQPVFKRYQIRNTRELPFSSNVLFWGKNVHALEEYLNIVNHKPVLVSPPLKQFKYGPVYKITFQN